MRRSRIKRLAVTAAVSGAVTMIGFGPVGAPAHASPSSSCADLGGEVVFGGGGPPRCVVTSHPNGGHTLVTTYEFQQGSYGPPPSLECLYNTRKGKLSPNQPAECPATLG